MIKSFKDKETERLFNRLPARQLPPDIFQAARRKLEILDAAETIKDLQIPPSNCLEKLSGKRSGQYSIRINTQWRICFNWLDNNALNVEITDYH